MYGKWNALFAHNQDNFFTQLIIQYEMWIHHFELEKAESKQWKDSNLPPPKKIHSQSSAMKVLLTQCGTYEFQSKKLTTITKTYYA